MPKVSICIPAYKQIEFLKRTLASVSEQEFSDYELIITDDSPDDAVEKLLNSLDLKEKLRYYKNVPALGSPGNWNFAMSKASGEYIKILHHDDLFTSPQSLGKFVKLLDDNKNADFAFSGTQVELLELKMDKIHSCSDKQFSRLSKHPDVLYFSNYIGAPSATIIRNSKRTDFDVNLKWLVDVDWYIQFILKSHAIAFTKEPLICTIHGGEGQITQSVISDKDIQIKEHIYLFEKLGDHKSDLKKYSRFFQLLFHRYKVNSVEELRMISPVSAGSEAFFKEAISLKDTSVFVKKLAYWLKKKSLKDHLFTLKTYFK
jgi:glycosyltransferase involved in cell wall biosynthesis